MNRRYISLLASVLYFVSLISLCLMAFHAFDVIKLTHGEKIFAGVLVVLSGYLAAFLRASITYNENRKTNIIRRQLFLIFLFYIIMLIDFTLIDDTFGRDIFNVFSWDKKAFSEYINTSTNLVPFETVRLFINGYENGILPLSAMLENIFGNLIVFMPLPFFILCLLKKINKWYLVLLAVLVSVIMVELLQFLFLTGSVDIDDLLLNMAGATAVYGILKIKSVGKALKKFTFGVWEIVEN